MAANNNLAAYHTMSEFLALLDSQNTVNPFQITEPTMSSASYMNIANFGNSIDGSSTCSSSTSTSSRDRTRSLDDDNNSEGNASKRCPKR